MILNARKTSKSFLANPELRGFWNNYPQYNYNLMYSLYDIDSTVALYKNFELKPRVIILSQNEPAQFK